MKTISGDLLGDVIQWDRLNWGKALNELGPNLVDINDGIAVTFGEREGGLSLWLALNGFKVTCTDFREFPPQTKELHKKHNVAPFIEYQKQDITNVTLPNNYFDVVMFKSVIGALGTVEKQTLAIKELHRILKPGGKLLFLENGSATRLHKWARKRFTKWSINWRYPSQGEFKEMLSEFSVVQINSIGFLAVFGRSEKQRQLLAQLDSVINPIVPKSWKYILYGVAVK